MHNRIYQDYSSAVINIKPHACVGMKKEKRAEQERRQKSWEVKLLNDHQVSSNQRANTYFINDFAPHLLHLSRTGETA